MWQEHRTEILNCNRQSYGAAKLIGAHSFKFNWWVLKPSLSHFSVLKSLHYLFCFDFLGVHLMTKYSRYNRESKTENGLRAQAICSCNRAWPAKEGFGVSGCFRYDTLHPKINHYKMHFRFLSAKWNAATRYSARPFTAKTGARVHFTWILHETADGIKHVFTLLVVEMVRGII